MEAAFDRHTHGLDPEAAVRIEQSAAVEDRQGTDVLAASRHRPATACSDPVRSVVPRSITQFATSVGGGHVAG
jgi:hypothetical protein